jgi:hypothetical protein
MSKKTVGLPKRKFDGEYYQFYDNYKTKKEAQNEASKLRAKGKLVRVTSPSGKLYPYYELWVK